MISRTLPTPRIVVLAAGFSSRLGQPKALAKVRGATLLARTLGVLAPFAHAAQILVVVPPRAARYRAGAHRLSTRFVANPQRAQGLSSSVRCGIEHARYSAAVLLLPVDLVRLTRRDIARLISRWRGARRRVVARSVHARAATPLILPRSLYARTRGLAGDEGLRDIVRGLARDRMLLVHLPSAQADVDTVEDLAVARRGGRFSP
jgi:molybdenum cofactor cytidylyltransferase